MELKILWRIIRRRKLIFGLVFSIFFLFMAGGSHFLTPIFEAECTLLIEDNTVASTLLEQLNIRAHDRTVNTDPDGSATAVMAQVIPLIKHLIKDFDLKEDDGTPYDPEELIETKLSHLFFADPEIEVNLNDDSEKIVSITARSPQPQQAADLANHLATLYINYRTTQLQNEFAEVANHLEQKITQVEQQYYSAIMTLEKSQLDSQTSNVSNELDILLARIQEVKTNYQNNNKALVQLNNEIKKLSSLIETLDDLQQGNTTSLRNRVIEIVTTLYANQASYTKDHPKTIKLQRELEYLQKLLKESPEKSLEILKSNVDSLIELLKENLATKKVEKQGHRAKKKPILDLLSKLITKKTTLIQLGNKQRPLNQYLDTTEKMYSKLLNYQMALNITKDLAVVDTKIASIAICPVEKDFPSKKLFYVAGFLLGLFWALLTILLLEYVDTTITRPTELTALTSLPCLGIIPYSSQFKYDIFKANIHQSKLETEAIRSLKNNLLWQINSSNQSIFLITSANPQEGRTTIATCLAAMLATYAQQTLLLELDLRTPGFKSTMNLDPAPGIHEILTENFPWTEALLESKIERLQILPAGRATPNPGPIIESSHLPTLLAELVKRFDFIIIDGPSALRNSDALLLARLVDGIIILAADGQTSSEQLTALKATLNSAGPPLIGTVLNKHLFI